MQMLIGGLAVSIVAVVTACALKAYDLEGLPSEARSAIVTQRTQLPTRQGGAMFPAVLGLPILLPVRHAPTYRVGLAMAHAAGEPVAASVVTVQVEANCYARLADGQAVQLDVQRTRLSEHTHVVALRNTSGMVCQTRQVG
jgi:hypothetical protein